MKRSILLLTFVCFILLLSFFGCKKQEVKDKNESEEVLPPEIVISRENKNLIFSYFDKDGNFKDVQNIDDIPLEYRKQVIVFDLSLPPEKRMAHKVIYLADLTQPDSNGRYRYTVASRYEFESSLKEFGQVALSSGADRSVTNGITIYTTSWCGVCAQLRKYLKSRGINFVEKDIEKDSSAQQEMLRKLRAKGMRGSGVPVIDINGEIIVGFNKELLDSKLK